MLPSKPEATSINYNHLREHVLTQIAWAKGRESGLVTTLSLTLDEAELLYLLLVELASAHGCIGYPECDGDLIGEPHSPPCPEAIGVDGGAVGDAHEESKPAT